MAEDNLNNQGGNLTPTGEPSPDGELMPTGEPPSVSSPTSFIEPTPVSDLIPQTELAPTPESALSESAQLSKALPEQTPSQKESLPPAPVSRQELKDLLRKAKEKIQFRKRLKLEKIIKLAQEKKKISNDDAQKLLRISDATATRYLSQLVKEGMLQRSGPANNAFYEPVP